MKKYLIIAVISCSIAISCSKVEPTAPPQIKTELFRHQLHPIFRVKLTGSQIHKISIVAPCFINLWIVMELIRKDMLIHNNQLSSQVAWELLFV